ncbi:MAG TPA: hypothetical protein VGJ48_08675 [Pyrinomonadaceae bacterium]|jgi:hypothetical protein
MKSILCTVTLCLSLLCFGGLRSSAASDFENPDAGEFPVGVKILATDFENLEAGAFFVGESDFDSHSFPLSSYTLTNIDGGNIQVH